VVERPGNYVFEDEIPSPKDLRTIVVSYVLAEYKVVNFKGGPLDWQ